MHAKIDTAFKGNWISGKQEAELEALGEAGWPENHFFTDTFCVVLRI